MKSVQKDVGNIHRATYATVAGARLLQPAAATAFQISDQAARTDHLGYKKPKHIEVIFVTNTYPGATGKTRGATVSAAVENKRSAALNTWQYCHSITSQGATP